MNKAAVTGFYEMIFTSMAAQGKPNPVLDFHDVLVDGDRYCCRFTMSGIHKGPFLGMPPTNKPYVLPGITIMHFKNRKVIERWSSADMLAVLVQIGAVPPPG